MTRGRPLGRWGLWCAVLLLLAPVGLVAPTARAASADVSIGGDGTVSVGLSLGLSNGSALREAMDGNFTGLVDLLTSNASARATLLAQIASAETTPFLGAFFGNRDGSVSSSEVSRFVSLLVQEAQLIPSNSLTGGSFLAFTLDGAAPTASHLEALGFANATGPAASPAPLTVSTSLSYDFPYSGTSHRLALSSNLSQQSGALTIVTGDIAVSITVPPGNTVTGTSGFDQASVSNDPLGWGAGRASGAITATSSGPLSVSFASSFPTGDLLIAAPIGAVGLLLGLVLWRRRRRRRSTPPSP